MTQQLNWCGWPIGPGESYYGGKPEHISETWGEKPAQAAAKQHRHCCGNYRGGSGRSLWTRFAYKLTRAEAAKLLEARTKTHRTSYYRALRLHGRFAKHLHRSGTMLSWRSL